MGLFSTLFGDANSRQIKKLSQIADMIEERSDEFAKKTDEELRLMTDDFKQRLENGETLDNILVEAFATVREVSSRVLNMRHFYVQLIGGIVLHQGRIAEMCTGEGKTLVATLAAYLNALAGKGVHIVTVNEYLAKRDAEWMGKIFKFLGLSVGYIANSMDANEKRAAYACDITYGTNNEFGFDYLRDNMVVNAESRMQRPLSFAIVDEVDSILIDEARTPLIISGKGDKSSDLYVKVAKFTRTLKPEVDYIIEEDGKRVNLTEEGSFRAERFFQIKNLGDSENTDLNHHIQQALKAHFTMFRDNHYVVNDGEIIIVDEFTGRLMVGRRFSNGLHQAIEAKENVRVREENRTMATITFQNYFRLYRKLSGMTGTAKTEEREFASTYALDIVVVPTNLENKRKDLNDIIYANVPAKLKAVVNRIEEEHKSGRPILVGTVTVEKSEQLSEMLKKRGIKHNVLNAKNNEREAEIVAQAGRKGTVTIATNMAGRGTDILLGGNPEYMAKSKLRSEGIQHELIEKITSYNPELTDEEKEIKKHYEEEFNKAKQITDKEKEEVVALGGLIIIGTERHESRRIDNQLRGRAGRQGDPGESVFFISVDDELIKMFMPGGVRNMVARFTGDDVDNPLSMKMLSNLIETSQRKIEGKNFGIRKHVLEYDNVMNRQREIIYAERDKILAGKNIHENVLSMFDLIVDEVLEESNNDGHELCDWDADLFNKNIESKLLPEKTGLITKEVLETYDIESLVELIKEKTINCYEDKILKYKEMGIDFNEVERVILLKNLDRLWVEHIDAMEELKRGVGFQAYAHSDPVVAFKKYGLEMFEELENNIQYETAKILLKAEFQTAPVQKQTAQDQAVRKPITNNSGENGEVISRNRPCPCGSGKKYKHCCGKDSDQV